MTPATVHTLPVPNVEVVRDFLAGSVRDNIHIVVIAPDGQPQPYGGWFGNDADAAAAWAISENKKGYGVYWTVNLVRRGLEKKPKKSDMVAGRFLHVDLDPPKDGTPFDRAGLLARLYAELGPSFVIDSGGGLQAFWRLEYLAENLPAVELLNRRVSQLFGGDHCHNIDRLMRLPGTVNYPNALKRARGRLPALATLVQDDSGECFEPEDLHHSLPALPANELVEHERVALDGVTLLSLAELKIGTRDKLHGMITSPRNPDRSAASYAVACEMVRRGFTDAQIAGVLFNPDLAISGHCLDQPSPMRSVGRAIGRARGDVASRAQAKGDLATAEDDAAGPSGPTPPPPSSSGAPAEPSEDMIALEFTRKFRKTLRFDHDMKNWFQWDGSHWKRNGTGLAFHYARSLGRTIGSGKKGMCKASVAAGAERFARADPVHALESSAWDSDPMLIATPGGMTVDLRTGEQYASRPEDLITKLTGAAPEKGDPVRWLRFLNEALDGDQEAIRFLQQWAGYCLTGDTREHALLFLHGFAGTGKTVFVNTLAHILGDYAVTSAMDTFTSSKLDRHPTELAMLRGARLVTASETEEGRTWAEARIKSMTGGDPITAHFMRQDNFTFRPQFKLTIVGNHAPRLTNPDDAMRRRFNILGFNIKPAVPDLQLEKKLEAEHGRILTWAIAGALDWQANGLVRPAVVTSATADYFAGEDLVGQWLSERCDVQSGKREFPARLYGDWQKYAGENGEDPGTAIGFGKKLKKKGFESKASNGMRWWFGLELRAPVGGYDAD